MNNKIISLIASISLGISVSSYILFSFGVQSIALHSPLFLLASFVGFGVSRYYQVTEIAIKQANKEME